MRRANTRVNYDQRKSTANGARELARRPLRRENPLTQMEVNAFRQKLTTCLAG